MPMLKSFAACAAVAIGVSTPHAFAQTAMPTAREVPARLLPVPTTVSPQMQKIIGAPISPTWKDFPKTAEEWKAQVDAAATASARALPAMREALAVKLEPLTIDGVKAYALTPAVIPPENRNRLLIHVHGGCYVSNPGEVGHRRGHHDGRLRTLQSHLGRLSHAARPSISGRAR